MSKINEIQAAILALEGGAYQKLMDQYLHRKYHFTNIHSLGIQNATNKTTKGIPDTYVINDDKYILICHGTVSEQPFNKIKRDITDCLDNAKTSLDSSKIAKIICCYTSSNITPKQREALIKIGGDIEVELISLSTLSHDLINNYRSLAADHLQIKIDTHQIFSIDDFIVSYDKSGTNAPIDTKFCFRKEELERVVESLKNNSITVLSGPSGIGKTRLALEACRIFEKDGWMSYCVRSNGELLYNDLEDYLDSNEKYLLFFDDANTVAQFGHVLEECFNLNYPAQIKAIITVRDYAKKQVLLETRKYSGSEEVIIDHLNDEAIKAILEENYNIRNHEYIEKICRVSKGNARLAVLAGIRSKEKGLPSISNAEDIFKNYYSPIIDRIGIDKKELILLGIISLFGAVNTKANDFYNYLTLKYLGEDYNVDDIEKLYELELVDWYEKEIVRISDQSLGNYILYLTVYEKAWIDLGDLIEQCVPKRTKLIVNLISMLLSLFGSQELSSQIGLSVNDSWDKAEQNLQKTYAILFYPINPLRGLLYLKNYVQNTTIQEYDVSNIDFEHNKNINNITTKEIEILSDFKYTDCYEEAVLLFFELYEKKPILFMDFYFAITNNMLFDKLNYRRGYSYEQKFLDLLWQKCKAGSDYNYSILYLRVAEYALGTEYTYAESNDKKTFTFVRMGLQVTDELKELRSSIWDAIVILYDNPDYYDLTKSILLKSHINGLYDNDFKVLCISDFNSLYSFLSKESPLSFDKAMVIGKYKNAFEQLNIEIDERFKVLDTSEEYNIYSIFSREFHGDYSFEEAEKKKQQNIIELVKDYSQEEYNSLFRICSFLEEQDVENEWDMVTGIETIFSFLETDVQKLPKVVKLYLSNGTPFNLRPARVLLCLLNNYGYDYTKSLISESEDSVFRKWYLELLYCIPEKDINEEISNDYFLFQRKEFAQQQGKVIPLLQIKKFLKYNKVFLNEINSFLLVHTEGISFFFGNAYEENTIRTICEYYSDNVITLIDLYFACDHTLFDYKDQLFWAIYELSPDLVWEKYISKLHDEKRIDNHENKAFAHIWGMPEYLERINYAFSELIEKVASPSKSLYGVLFAPIDNDPNEERKKEWILSRIHENVGNVILINRILDIVTTIYPAWKIDIIVYYLKYDQDIKNFKKLYLLPTFESWSGSEIPVINRRIQSLIDIRDSLSGIEYIEHKAYLDELINSKEQHREAVKKREYIEEYSV